MGKKTLGRGLDSLFSSVGYKGEDTQKNEGEVENTPADTMTIKMDLIKPDPDQPRKNFNQNSINELAESIKNYGVIQPIILRQSDKEGYIIVAGERRFRAAKIAGLDKIPAIVREFTKSQVREISIIENLQREDLNPVEAAKAVKSLMENFNWTHEEVASRLGKSRSSISNMVRILDLYPEVIEMIEKGAVSSGHARSLVVIKDRGLQIALAKKAANKTITVRDLEEEVKKRKGIKDGKSRKVFTTTPEMEEFKEYLEEFFATKIVLKGSEEKGKIIISYTDSEDLERILERIKSK